MESNIKNIIEQNFDLQENEGADKVLPLAEAVKRAVKPGMKIHMALEANGTANEIIRQFNKTAPGFTLIMPGVIGVLLNLVYCGLIKKIITSNCSFLAPSIAPSGILQRAYKEKSVIIEDWSLCTITQRLMAGALGLPFMPTGSITGSSMEQENIQTFKKIKDPFGSGRDTGLVKALNPDLSIIHAWAADPHGNTIISPASPSVSWDSNLWGPKASKKVLVSVEKIVTTDFIRNHSSLVKLPGHMVESVSLVPFGAHPVSFISQGIESFSSYGDDYDFMKEHKKAVKAPDLMDKWLEEWIFKPRGQTEYLKKIGVDKIEYLKKKSEKNAWKKNQEKKLRNISATDKATDQEAMVVIASRTIKEQIIKNSRKVMLAGAGVASLASWLAYYKLKKENYDVEIMSGSGILGYAPRPFDSFFASIHNIPYCKMLTDTLDIYGVIVGGANSTALSVLGAGQIDKQGNVNSTKIGGSYITGSGGSNDAANAREVVIVAEQSKKRFVDKVPYITFPGNRVTTLISSMGIYKKEKNNDEFILTEYFPDPFLSSRDEIINKIKNNCGWEIKIAENPTQTAAPSMEELLLMRSFTV